jgi:hypothetical protein
MATSDILGLFTTPEQYQQAQRQAQEAQALQYASIDPRAQAQYGFYRAGQQLGGAIGGALGGTDPMLQKISQRQQLIGMIDQSNPDSYVQAIETALRGGDQEAAYLLRNEMMKSQQQAQELKRQTQQDEIRGYQVEDILGQRTLTKDAKTRQVTANQLFGQLKNPDGTINEQVKNQLLAFPEGRQLISEQAKAIPDLRKLGVFGGAVEVNPFQRFLDDPNAPDWIKNSAKQFATSFSAGVYNEEQTDKFVNKLDESLGRLEPKTLSYGDQAERYASALFGKPYNKLTQDERTKVNNKIDEKAAANVPKMSVNLNDPTAAAKSQLDVMGKWEQFIGKGGDVEVANRFKAVKSAVAMNNSTADGALLYNIAKMYDPTGAVQEGDKRTILGNPAIPEKFQLLVQGVLNGGSFTPPQRQQLLKIANDIVTNRESQLNVYRKQYIGKIQKFDGTEDDILNPYKGLIKPPLTEFIQQTPNTNPLGITGGRR